MSRSAKRSAGSREVDDYRHEEALRLNNPEAGLARYETEKPPTKRYEYDPRLDPQLDWAGKAERTSFEVDAVSIHVHERLSTEAIVRTLGKEQPQLALFGDPQLDRDREVEFYQHEVDWTNRLILGDSLVVMTSLLERERMAGQVQCIYFDPPYGINYNSNFQARISNRSPREGSEDALTREPEQIQAYRDTWTLGVHSYLTYLRDRLLTAYELLSEEGSIFVQIGPDRLHLVRALLDEVFGGANSVTAITVQKTSQVTSKLLPEVADFLLWYAKDKERVRYFQLFEDRATEMTGQGAYRHVEIDGERRPMTADERADPSLLPEGARIFRYGDATSQGFSPTKTVDFEFRDRVYHPGANRHWLLRPEGMQGLAEASRLAVVGDTLSYVRYVDEGGLVRRTNIWTDTGQAGFASRKKQYVVETNPKIVERCILMTTQPGDLVLDPTCGSGTTAYVAEKHGRRWITRDTSRVALSLARERLLTSTFPYYRLIDDQRGVDAGIRYEKRSWVKASTIGYGDEEFDEIVLYDQPEVDASRIRVSGPFTVEALSRYAINPLQDGVPADPGELTATADHVDALLDALRVRGIPVKNGEDVKISSLSRLAGTDPLHAEGTTEDGRRFGVSVGPRYGPITRGQVDDALDNAYGYELVVFAGFTATAEVQTFLAKGRAGRYKVVLLEANADLLVADLLKNTKASQTFRLFAAPDVAARRHPEGGVFVELRGVDVYDASKGEATSRTRGDIAAWFLDHDYDGEVFHVNQAFFPKTNAWDALARALKGTLDEEALAKLAEFQSNPFTPGEHRRAAVRVIDDSGQTSEAVVGLDL
jgi:adenine-specific DNA-methyltransferase